MLVPSIDIQQGQVVQLVGGEELAISAGAPLPIARRFSVAGEIALIDLDAARGIGNNEELLAQVVEKFPCRVGGGIRDLETAKRWLNRGAQRIILGTAAKQELLRELPRERLIAAVDARNGEVVVEGWRTGTGRPLMDVVAELNPYVDSFLVTFVEREGRMQGTNVDMVRDLVKITGRNRLTIAGGITTAAEIRILDELGVDAQIGMALYSGKISLGEAIAAPIRFNEQGLIPSVVTDEQGVALGLVWSSRDSIVAAVESLSGVYQSRTRGLWRKGESSGNTQELLSIALDCDRDALRFTVRQRGNGFCHNGTASCWGENWNFGTFLQHLEARSQSTDSNSLTRKLFEDPRLLSAKLVEEARELACAPNRDNVVAEMADLLYFASVAIAKQGVNFSDVLGELRRRSLKVSRRPTRIKEEVLQ